MNNTNGELTLLSEEQVFSHRLGVFKKYGTRVAAMTDLAIVTGGYYQGNNAITVPDDHSLKGRTGDYYTRSCNESGDIYFVSAVNLTECWERKLCIQNGVIRPILISPIIFDQIFPNRTKGYNGTEEVIFGEYPQYAPKKHIQAILERKYQKKDLCETGRSYTFNVVTGSATGFWPRRCVEYEYKKRKYIRVQVNIDPSWSRLHTCSGVTLSNDVGYEQEDFVWIEVTPVVWLIDDDTKTLISKRGLLSGLDIGYNLDKPNDFNLSGMHQFLNDYMLKDLMQSVTLSKTQVETQTKVDDQIPSQDPKIDAAIKKIMESIEGSSIEKEIKIKLENLLEEYNYHLDRIKNTMKIGNEPTLEVKDKNYYYSKLLTDLESLFQKIQQFNQYNQQDTKMIQECLNILSGNESEIGYELGRDIDLLVNKILPFLKEERQNAYKTKIQAIFKKYKKAMTDYFNGTQVSYANIHCEIRKELQPILEEIKKEVSKEYIQTNLGDIVNGIFSNANNDLTTFYLTIINQIAEKIRGLIAQSDKKEYYDKLNQILNNSTNEDSLDELISMIKNLYKLQLKLENYMKEVKKIDNLHYHL